VIIATARVRSRFGIDISGDLSLLHTPVAESSKIYDRAIKTLRNIDGNHLKLLMDVREQGVVGGQVAVTQCDKLSSDISTLLRSAAQAQNSMRKRIEPEVVKLLQWKLRTTQPSGVPSAEEAIDLGCKDAQYVGDQVCHWYNGQLNMCVDAAELKLIFVSCELLLQGLNAFQENFTVVSIVNQFQNPTPVGRRCVRLIVDVPIEPVDFKVAGEGEGGRHADKHGEERGEGEDESESEELKVSEAGEGGRGRRGGQGGAVVKEPRVPDVNTFLVQVVLQLECFELAEHEAAIHRNTFKLQLRNICNRRVPAAQSDALRHMIDHLLTSVRPPSFSAIQWSGSDEEALSKKQRFRSSSDADLATPLVDVLSDDDLTKSDVCEVERRWYDIRWVLEFQNSQVKLVLQDALVLLKTLAASVALFFVTRPQQLIHCYGLQYSVTQRLSCQDVNTGAIRVQLKTDSLQVEHRRVHDQCDPQLDLSALDTFFTVLIIMNQLVFASFMMLRYAAYQGWRVLHRSHWLKANSLKIVLGFVVATGALAMLKIYVALSYSRSTITYAKPVVTIELPSQLTNCTNITMTSLLPGSSTKHQGTTNPAAVCSVKATCDQQCMLVTPPTLQTLCPMYLFATAYIFYLGYEFHRSLCLDKKRFTLKGRLANIARQVTPFMAYFPDVSAIMKYVLAILTISIALNSPDMITCSGYDYGSGAVGTGIIEEGCNASMDQALKPSLRLFLAIAALQVILFMGVMFAKLHTPMVSRASAIVKGFFVLQVLLRFFFFRGRVYDLRMSVPSSIIHPDRTCGYTSMDTRRA
jgi:hypothetical protein